MLQFRKKKIQIGDGNFVKDYLFDKKHAFSHIFFSGNTKHRTKSRKESRFLQMLRIVGYAKMYKKKNF